MYIRPKYNVKVFIEPQSVHDLKLVRFRESMQEQVNKDEFITYLKTGMMMAPMTVTTMVARGK